MKGAAASRLPGPGNRRIGARGAGERRGKAVVGAKGALLSIPPAKESVPAAAGNSFEDNLLICMAPVIDREVMALEIMLVSITEALEKDQEQIGVLTLS